jgi:hypothetical protein
MRSLDSRKKREENEKKPQLVVIWCAASEDQMRVEHDKDSQARMASLVEYGSDFLCVRASRKLATTVIKKNG